MAGGVTIGSDGGFRDARRVPKAPQAPQEPLVVKSTGKLRWPAWLTKYRLTIDGMLMPTPVEGDSFSPCLKHPEAAVRWFTSEMPHVNKPGDFRRDLHCSACEKSVVKVAICNAEE